MSNKQKKKGKSALDLLRPDRREEEFSPFSSIVLKEKKEEKKAKPIQPKKTSDIIQGYDPNASFKDILYAWEHEGTPYSMPKKKRIEDIKNSSSKQSFGDILDKWEGKGKSKEKKSETKRVSPEYKASRSFGDILNQFEGVKPKKDVPAKKENKLPGKGEYKRVSQAYEGIASFSDILDEYEGKKKPKAEVVLSPSSEPLQKEEIKKATFFREKEEDDERPANVAWSIFGDNKPLERKTEEKQVHVEEKKESIKRVSPEYKPTEDFAAILSSFEAEKGKKIISSSEETIKVEAEEEVLPHTFFKEKEEDEERPANVAWSIFGDNKPIERPKKEKEPTIVAASAKPKKEFHAPVKNSHLFKKSVEKPIAEKSFEDILREKGEESAKKVKTMSELRLMLPQATLDLHGMVYTEAESAINRFLDDSIEAGIEKVSIIHGKGLHAENGEGVLGDLTLKVLREKGVSREATNPKIQFGGSGALWIILKRKEVL